MIGELPRGDKEAGATSDPTYMAMVGSLLYVAMVSKARRSPGTAGPGAQPSALHPAAYRGTQARHPLPRGYIPPEPYRIL